MFAVLFDRHAGDIESFLRRRIGADAAEDALSDTFLIAFRRRGSFDHAWSSARPWLFGIATHVAAKHRTAEARHWRAIEAAAGRGEFTTGGGIDEATGAAMLGALGESGDFTLVSADATTATLERRGDWGAQQFTIDTQSGLIIAVTDARRHTDDLVPEGTPELRETFALSIVDSAPAATR